MNDRRNILILAGDADGNLGDRAILAAMCQTIHHIDPQIVVAVVSKNPQVMEQRLPVTAIRRGLRSLPALCKVARRSRLVFIGGGGLFQDDDSLIKMPYWAARCALMRLLGPRIVGCSLGVGPLRSSSSRLSAMATFAMMASVSVRDELARQTARPLTSKRVELTPDPALMLEPLDSHVARHWLSEQGVPLDGAALIGITIRRWFPPKRRWIPNQISAKFKRHDQQDRNSERMVNLLAEALDQIIERCGGRVLLMPTYNVANEGDDRLCRQVMDAMSCDRVHLLRMDDPALYKAVAGHLAVMIGGRMHPTIFAASMGTPVVGLAYNPKFIGLFTLLGITHRVMSVETFVDEGDVTGLVNQVEAAMTQSTNLRNRAGWLAEQTRVWIERQVREATASC